MASRIASKSSVIPGLFEALTKRSLVKNIYPESQEFRNKLSQMLTKPAVVYAGFDATSDSLHVGNLVSLMSLMHFQRHGHQVICVIGDATTTIGDPSGHTKDREKIDRNEIEHNSKCIKNNLEQIFHNHIQYFKPSKSVSSSFHEPIIINNSTWYHDIKAVDFVSDIFREVRVGGLLHKKSIAERLKSPQGMNMSEFCYQIFQAYDWMQLRALYDCRLQVGGSDQAGNIYTGHEFIKKYMGASDAIGILAPLLVDNETGKKLGKSTTGSKKSVWLSRAKTSPYNLFQYFHQTSDSDVKKLLDIFTFYDDTVIEDLIYSHLKKPEDIWFCQRKLAEQVCKLVHGESGLDSAKRLTHAFHSKSPLEIGLLSEDELYELFEHESIIHILHREGLRVSDLMRKTNCFKSDMDAERLVRGGGLRLNGQRVESFNVPITSDIILANGITLMRVGKKNHFLFKWTNS